MEINSAELGDISPKWLPTLGSSLLDMGSLLADFRVFSTYGSDAANHNKMLKNIVLNKPGMLLDISYTLKTHHNSSRFSKQ